MTTGDGAARPGGADEVAEADFRIVNERGLHARAATKLVQLAGKFSCEVMISGTDAEAVNAKSVMGVLLLCGAKGTVVSVSARGVEARRCVDAIGELIASRFGEPE
ncbi:MAG: HPr family phosphocarrier protein [Polyangiaceae bacterium]|nr:HPr family phosphocarrier protein [Polyangiaceae bacterium]MBK8939148.1 HPr family phosphocarrier protein [Polyangiaceae bacterium]